MPHAARVRYTTLEIGDMDIHIRMLRDVLQFDDSDGVAGTLGISSAAWPLFGVIWPSGEVLAHLMLDYQIKGKRVLEVGCGIALASLVLNRRAADITATDHHPAVRGFLDYNVGLNNGKIIPFVRTGWGEPFHDKLGTFDLIIGSDLLYEDAHVNLLAAFINQHVRPCCEVVIVDPGRGFHAKFTSKMKSLGYSQSRKKPENIDYLEKHFKGWILTYFK
ncbi:class I SAM-dependent methyltransferase [Desulfobacter curvatus]|uniref:class I SAM-dependent methyltransferase n=1 Tax=Desulfobacter curvatus TaxID=2290 RepID=UPI00037F568E|nr:methyltransferase domain-containing protein [Desulfobacter curvatus]